MPTTPEDHMAARKRGIYRRRQIFTALLFAAGVSLLLAIVPDLRWMLKVNLVADGILLVYVAALLQIKRHKRVERRLATPQREALPERELLPEEDEEEPYLRAGQL
jgi:ABC-type uncharacterized transport system permease subunit